ncbi:MAG TPA: hypothetical protein VF306_06225, partial [Pirellulales bacterium]
TPREKEEGRRSLPPFLAVNHCSTGASPAVAVRNKSGMEFQLVIVSKSGILRRPGPSFSRVNPKI